MAYEVKTAKPCHKCGNNTTRRVNVSRLPQCMSCAVTAATENAIQISRKSGPYYERWRDAMKRSFGG